MTPMANILVTAIKDLNKRGGLDAILQEPVPHLEGNVAPAPSLAVQEFDLLLQTTAGGKRRNNFPRG